MSATAGVAAVVLAGGLSSRLGQEKALLRVHGGENPDLLRRTHDLLCDLVPECWVACRPGRPRDGYACIFDREADLGPISGIYAALCEARHKGYGAVLALSCDLPFMDTATLRRLLEAREAAPSGRLMTTYLQAETGFIESLTAIYEVAALPLIEEALHEGLHKLSRIVPKAAQTHIAYSQTEALPFFNINYPADLELVRRLLATL